MQSSRSIAVPRSSGIVTPDMIQVFLKQSGELLKIILLPEDSSGAEPTGLIGANATKGVGLFKVAFWTTAALLLPIIASSMN